MVVSCQFDRINSLNFIFLFSERLSRSNGIAPEPYRSQSMAILPDQYHYHQNQEKGLMNKTNGSTGRKPSSDQQRKSTSRSSAGRARSTRPLRETIRSAVPDSSIISMAKRPDRGGTGKLLFLFHFKTTTATLLLNLC